MRRWRRRRRLQFGNLQRHANILQQKSFKVVFSPQTKRSVHLTFVDHNDNDGNVYDVEDEFEAEVANSHDKFTFSKQNVIVIFDAAVSSPLLLSTYTETCIEKVHLSLSLSLSVCLNVWRPFFPFQNFSALLLLLLFLMLLLLLLLKLSNFQ